MQRLGEPDGMLLDPCKQAAVAGIVMIGVLWVARLLGPRGVTLERYAAFLFLAGMVTERPLAAARMTAAT